MFSRTQKSSAFIDNITQKLFIDCMNSKMRGFTLVELSIVLVIIGLLIGSILVAQSMIGTSKIQAFVRQVQQYDIAVRTSRPSLMPSLVTAH